MARKIKSFWEWLFLSMFSGLCSLILGLIKNKPTISEKESHDYHGGWCRHDD